MIEAAGALLAVLVWRGTEWFFDRHARRQAEIAAAKRRHPSGRDLP